MKVTEFANSLAPGLPHTIIGFRFASDINKQWHNAVSLKKMI
ncbi:hypothetical protein [Dongia sp.]